MSPPDRLVATSDCEHCRPGPISQPANTLSSLAYVVAGASMLRSARGAQATSHAARSERLLAWTVIGAGLGSVAYHGPGGGLSRYAHDASLIAMLAMVAVSDAELLSGKQAPVGVLAAVAVATLAGAHPSASMAAQAIAATTAATGEVTRTSTMAAAPGKRWARRAEFPAFIIGAAAHLTGRTGGPLCRPHSVLQPHALWHLLTATTVWLRSASLARQP